MQHATGSDALFLPVWIAATLGTFGTPELAMAESAEGGVVEVARNAPGPCGPQGVPVGGPLTLYIQPPNGRTMRLTYSVNEGWRSSKTGPTQVAAAASSESEVEADQPMTVFIDGPSGFTYFWIQDKGWKFVGHLTDRIE